MPGAVDLLVRVPLKKPLERITTIKRDPDEGSFDVPPNRRQIEQEAGLKYSSHHYPTEGKNLLAHVRGYMETTPDGKKVFHVFEVQSDWAQARRRI
jgi:hypothetical protein